jgi:hypothetical protein
MIFPRDWHMMAQEGHLMAATPRQGNFAILPSVDILF